MQIQVISAKSILTTSNLPAVDYCINPYIGCSHGCIYCYAKFMKRFTGHKEDWGQFVDVKINAPVLLKNEIKSKKVKEGSILIGSVTDAYQPVENKYQITRNILKELVNTDFSVSILTKSALVTRDIDILVNLKVCEVGLTITTTNDSIRKTLEPFSGSVKERLNSLQILHKAGIPTYAFVGPIFPLITDLKTIFKELDGICDSIWGEALNIRGGNWDSISDCIRRYFPIIENGYRKKITSSSCWDQIEIDFNSLCQQHSLPLIGFFRHGV